jgi:hypothetical protein
LQISLGKVFRIGKRWLWHTDVYFQQKAGNVDLNLPTIFTRNRIGYEGTLGFRKLNIATGFEVKYHTLTDADGYSTCDRKFFYRTVFGSATGPISHIIFIFGFEISGLSPGRRT